MKLHNFCNSKSPTNHFSMDTSFMLPPKKKHPNQTYIHQNPQRSVFFFRIKELKKIKSVKTYLEMQGRIHGSVKVGQGEDKLSTFRSYWVYIGNFFSGANFWLSGCLLNFGRICEIQWISTRCDILSYLTRLVCSDWKDNSRF